MRPRLVPLRVIAGWQVEIPNRNVCPVNRKCLPSWRPFGHPSLLARNRNLFVVRVETLVASCCQTYLYQRDVQNSPFLQGLCTINSTISDLGASRAPAVA